MDQGNLSAIEQGDKGVSLKNLRALAGALRCTASHLLGEDPQVAEWVHSTVRAELLRDADTPDGLRDLAGDRDLVGALRIRDSEWRALASIHLPGPATREGYARLLLTIRAIV